MNVHQGSPGPAEGQVRRVRPGASQRAAADFPPEGCARQEEDMPQVRVRREEGTLIDSLSFGAPQSFQEVEIFSNSLYTYYEQDFIKIIAIITRVLRKTQVAPSGHFLVAWTINCLLSESSDSSLLLPLARRCTRSHYLVHQSPVLTQCRSVSETFATDVAVAGQYPSVLQLMCPERIILPGEMNL